MEPETFCIKVKQEKEDEENLAEVFSYGEIFADINIKQETPVEFELQLPENIVSKKTKRKDDKFKKISI